MTHRGAAIGIQELLQQAEGFEQAGDYLEARARARAALDELVECTASSTRARVERTFHRYDLLAAQWQAQNAARGAAHTARELEAIGGGAPEPAVRETAWRRGIAWLDALRSRQREPA